MTNEVRLGIAGDNVNSLWASQPHFPALPASPTESVAVVLRGLDGALCDGTIRKALSAGCR